MDKVVIVCCGEVQIIMGDSRNIHTIPRMAFRNPGGKGGSFELEIQRHGGILMIGIPKAWGVLDLRFPQETDKSVFLENTNFMDF